MENLYKIFGFPKDLMKVVKEEVKGELFEDFEIREQLQNGMLIITSPNFFQASAREEMFENISDKESENFEIAQTNHEIVKVCQYCSKILNNEGEVEKHQMICLKRHQGVYIVEKPYCCDTCKKCFEKISDMKRHVRIHTDEKPFCCKTCKKYFNELNKLRIHERIHTGEKPYCCRTCKKCFSNKSSL